MQALCTRRVRAANFPSTFISTELSVSFHTFCKSLMAVKSPQSSVPTPISIPIPTHNCNFTFHASILLCSPPGKPHRGSVQCVLWQNNQIRHDTRCGSRSARNCFQRRHLSHLAALHRRQWTHCQTGAYSQAGGPGPSGRHHDQEEDT